MLWHQSVNVVGSYHTRFGPQIRNDTYLEYEAFAKKDWFDFYGYADAPVFFGGNSDAKGIWNHGSPLFMEIEPRFSIDKLTNTDHRRASNELRQSSASDRSSEPEYGWKR